MGDQQPKGWHAEDIKAGLRKRHRSMSALARSWGLHPNTIAVVLQNGSRMPRVEELIARELGVTPHTLWPDRWTPEGERRPLALITADHSRDRAPCHLQTLGAA